MQNNDESDNRFPFKSKLLKQTKIVFVITLILILFIALYYFVTDKKTMEYSTSGTMAVRDVTGLWNWASYLLVLVIVAIMGFVFFKYDKPK